MALHYSTIFEAHADLIGGQTAIVQGSVRRSWADFDDRAARFASALAAHGLTRGSRVGQLLYNSPELLETYHGSLKMRALPFNINYRYTAEEILYILNDAQAEALVFHSSLAPIVAHVLPRARSLKIAIVVGDAESEIEGAVAMESLLAAHQPGPRIARSPDDPTMIYTGGTTGMPKGVLAPIRPHLESVLQATPPMMNVAPLSDPADLAPLAARLHKEGRALISLPLSPMVHGAALNISALPALIMGGTVVLARQRHFDPSEAWDLVEREHVTSLLIVGDAFARPLLAELQQGKRRDLSSLHAILSAGALFSSEVKNSLLSYLPVDGAVIDFISATEAAMGTSIATRGRPAETGVFHPNPGVIVVDDNNRPIAAGSGEAGRVAVPSSARGYLHDDAKTASTFPDIDGQRYAIPGDYALVEADGSLRLLGRGSSCINTGGLKVFPDEVEEALKAHPAVRDVVVVGLPDDRFGQRVTALLSLWEASPVTIEEILAAARKTLAGYKIPKFVRIVDAVPRNNIGKHDYAAARKLLEQ
ncbi:MULTISPECIES: AMP-binding protein [Hyphomonas]|uniref:AMP-binding protein n=1 Tax=Hyphomonas TaxID=85 RepID=UPI0030018AC4